MKYVAIAIAVLGLTAINTEQADQPAEHLKLLRRR